MRKITPFIVSVLSIILFSTIASAADRHVRDYNGNVQAASDACSPGDTLHFDGLVQSVSFTPKSGVNYAGEGAILTSPGSGHAVLGFNTVDKITFTGFHCIGPSVNGISITNSSITKNTFFARKGEYPITIWVSAPGAMDPSQYADWNAKCPATALNTHIDDNDFDCDAVYEPTGDQREGIHMRFDTPAPSGTNAGPGKTSGFTFNRNRIRHFSRCFGEFQGGSIGSQFFDNVCTDPVFSRTWNTNTGAMGLSLAMDASIGTDAERNYIDGFPSRTIDGTGVRNGIEGSGKNILIKDNYIANLNNAADLNNCTGGRIINNRFVNNISGGVATQMQNGFTWTIANNTPDQVLTWDIKRSWPFEGGSQTAVPVKWTVVNGQAAADGVIDTTTFGVLKVFQVNGNWYQLNDKNEVWTLPGTNSQNVTSSITPPITTTTQPAKSVMIGHSLDGGKNWIVDSTVTP